MKLPNAEKAEVPRAKVTDYLLSPSHSGGRGKARFFRQFGFEREAWTALRDALIRHAREYDVARTEGSTFGRRYIIDGPVRSPDGRDPLLRSVWFIESGEDRPRFVTAYPLRRRKT